MHLAPLFKAVHAGHHRSITPTPWAILAFQPLETISQFGFFALVIFFVPLHPATLLAYLLFDGIVNAARHCGHEFVSQSSQKHWLLKYLNAVTHHDRSFGCGVRQDRRWMLRDRCCRGRPA
jgi:sterol desaturase/sphingolipid hydroxylase (fatty acid hydroxylase superfamily)